MRTDIADGERQLEQRHLADRAQVMQEPHRALPAWRYPLLEGSHLADQFLKHLLTNSWVNRIGEAVGAVVLLAEYINDCNFI
jgi:hypothetical protein